MPLVLVEALQTTLFIIFIYITLWFIASLFLKRNDVADIAWGIGFVLIAVFSYIQNGISIDRGLLVTILILIWGTRLAYHISQRVLKSSEDKRYKAWRMSWGKLFIVRSYLQVFMLQGLLLFLIISPVIIVNVLRGGAWTLFDLLGLAIWIIGFYFEYTGDHQLRIFLSNPDNKGKILDTGLWKYTRHPNYFGEVTQWWGLFVIALSVPYGLWGIIGPLVITFLILKVSGIPMLEKSMENNPLFIEYCKTTNKFFPNIKMMLKSK